jgi:hypothetical protein
MRTLRLLAPALILAAAACEPENAITINHSRPYRGLLRPVADCADLEQSLKGRLIERMAQQVAQNRDYALQGLQNDWWCCNGGCYDYGEGASANGGMPPSPGAPGAGDTSASPPAAGDYSTTNNQVAGVDEADFIENDGSYIYLVSGDQFLIFAAWPAAETHVLSSTPIEGRPQKLFVEGGRALIYSDVGTPACTWDGYGSYVDGTELKLTVLDIGTPSAPRLERELRVNGGFEAARRIGKAIHTVVTFPQQAALSQPTWPTDLDLCAEGLT